LSSIDIDSTGRDEFAGSLLDLVALGTVADVVPLLGENRGLVRDGLARINTKPRLGIAALMRAANVKAGSVNSASVGFGLAPRLNAAGRLDTAMNAYDLLTAAEPTWADELANALNERNAQRQAVTAEVAHAAEQAAFEGQAGLPALLFAASEEYSPGVIGLAAARLVERHYRPSVVVAIQDSEARGSCRSTEGFHITSALDECRNLLIKHGGHAAAAGFTARADALGDLRRQLLAIAWRDQPPGGWTRALRADAGVRLEKLTFQTYDQLRQLEPHGLGNPQPVFVARAVVQGARRVGRADDGQQPAHLQLRLRDGRGATWHAIGWRMGEREAEAPPGATIEVAFQLDMNEWNGERRLQLVMQDFR
jgi:single-stranded-DNA-specific exonuclease